MTTDRENSTASLRNLFHKEIKASGGNPSAAFIAVLDELDRRTAEGTDQSRKNAKLVSLLIDWFKKVDGMLEDLPSTITGRVCLDLRRLMPELTREMEEKATLGAREGAAATLDAIQALREATERYNIKKRRLVKVMAFGLPIILFSALFFGMVLGNLIIPALPNTWQWPCKLIGADYRTSTDPQNQTTFCVVQRD